MIVVSVTVFTDDNHYFCAASVSSFSLLTFCSELGILLSEAIASDGASSVCEKLPLLAAYRSGKASFFLLIGLNKVLIGYLHRRKSPFRLSILQ